MISSYLPLFLISVINVFNELINSSFPLFTAIQYSSWVNTISRSFVPPIFWQYSLAGASSIITASKFPFTKSVTAKAPLSYVLHDAFAIPVKSQSEEPSI